MKDCVLDDNISGRVAGAIAAGFNTTLDIQHTNFTSNSAVEGGVIDVDQQSYLHVTDCVFKDNSAKVIGGAIVGGLEAILEINGSCFSNNSARSGGAISVQEQVNLSLTNCRLEYNFASEIGGSISACPNHVILRIRETNFTGNSAQDGGALIVRITDCHIVRCVFNYNTAQNLGGALYIALKSPVQVENTNFTNNNAIDAGAIYIDSNSKLQANMCNFWKNLAKRAGGAIVLKGYSSAVIETCHFLSNHAVDGGAVNVNDPENFSVISTSFLRNVASDHGGAVAITYGANVMINNIICVGNRGPNGGGCLNVDSVTLTLSNSDIRDNIANFGAGVLASDTRIQVGVSLTN